MGDPANLKELDAVLEYHVVAGTAAFVKDLTDGERIKTLEGDDVLIKINSAIRINDATAIITDIAASNGVIHIINKVLDPSTAGFNIVEVAGTAAFAQDLTDGEKIKTVEGDSVLIKLNDATGHATGKIMINDATAIVTDIEASNGVIHIINKVLDPSTAGFNIVEVAAAQPELSTLVTALKAG